MSPLALCYRAEWQPSPALLPGKSHGRRSLVGCSPWGREESDTTEWLHLHFSLSRIGEGNGNPLHCSCLENPRDWRAWWAAVYGVAQSQTQLKPLSSSSSGWASRHKISEIEAVKSTASKFDLIDGYRTMAAHSDRVYLLKHMGNIHPKMLP